MIEPGTPAIDLPAFAPPTFTAAGMPIGAEVAPFTLESTSPATQINVPFTFGQPFEAGQLAPTDGLIAVYGDIGFPLQFNVKATHDDGSVRHAIISGVWPSLAAGEQCSIRLARASASPAAPVEMALAPMHAVVTVDGVEYKAVPEGEGDAWLSGPIVADRTYNVPFARDGVPHADLTAQFCVRHYPGAGVSKIDMTVEHTKAYSLTGDITYDVQLIVDGQVRYEKLGLVHFPSARWKKTFWIGQDHPAHIKHDVGYLLGTMAVSNYDQSVVVPEKTLAEYAAMLTGPNFAPMGNGRFQKSMGVVGGRPDIGLAPDSYAAAILSQDKRAKAMMLASADMAGSWSTHRRDRSNGPAAGRPMDIIHWPRSSIMGNPSDTLNKLTGEREYLPQPASTSLFKPDTAHQPAFAYIPYLLTGDFYYLEELHFWANYCLYCSNPGLQYRVNFQGLIKHEQVRAQGWTLRTLGEAAYMTPDSHPSKAAFHFWCDNNLDYYNDYYVDRNDNELGILSTGYAIAYSVQGASKSAIAPWQDHFFTQSIGHVAELGSAKAAKLLRWKAKFPIGCMVGEGFCYTNATAYALGVREGLDAPVFKTFAEVQAKSYPGAVVPSPPIVPGKMLGYPDLTTGYPANMQPALAMSVDTGIEGAAEAWRLFDSRFPKPNYGKSPQFAIVPRTIAAAIPADPPVEPPVIVTPTPVPTPEPTPTPTPTPTPAPVEPPPVVTEPLPPVTPDPVEPGPVPVPPVVEPPATPLGSLTFSHPGIAGMSNLTILVGDLSTMRVFAFHADADANGTLTVHSALILPQKRYGAVATSSTGEILAVMFPVIGA